jgi:hypothetical protein
MENISEKHRNKYLMKKNLFIEGVVSKACELIPTLKEKEVRKEWEVRLILILCRMDTDKIATHNAALAGGNDDKVLEDIYLSTRKKIKKRGLEDRLNKVMKFVFEAAEKEAIKWYKEERKKHEIREEISSEPRGRS